MKNGWDKKTRTLAWEWSDLSGRVKNHHLYNCVTVLNESTGEKRTFIFSGADKDGEGETHGWRYVSIDGMKLLLIND